MINAAQPCSPILVLDATFTTDLRCVLQLDGHHVKNHLETSKGPPYLTCQPRFKVTLLAESRDLLHPGLLWQVIWVY